MKCKDILPFENYVIRTKLSEDEIKLRLDETVETGTKSTFSLLKWNNREKPYTGELNGNSFKIRRIIFYTNSFLPIIKGEIFTCNSLTHIKIKMKVHSLILVFWYLIVGIISFGMIAFGKNFISFQKDESFISDSAATLIFIFLFLVLPVIAFKIESTKSKKYFSSLFEQMDQDPL